MFFVLFLSCLLSSGYSTYRLGMDSIGECKNGICDVVINMEIKLSKDSGDVAVYDPFRDVIIPIPVDQDTMARYRVKYASATQIYDVSIFDRATCVCPLSGNDPTTSSPCSADMYALDGYNPSWEVQVYPRTPGNDCPSQQNPATCCYVVVPRTTQGYDVYGGLTNYLLGVEVSYKHSTVMLEQGKTVTVADANLTMGNINFKALSIGNWALVLDPYGNHYTLPRAWINEDTEFDPNKAGWWKQDAELVKSNWNQGPVITSAKTSTFTSRIKPISVYDVPKEAPIDLIPTFNSRPGVKLMEAEIFWYYNQAEVKMVSYSSKLVTPMSYLMHVFTTGGKGTKVTLCILYPIICACEIPAGKTILEFNGKWCKPIVGYLRVVTPKEDEVVYAFLDGNGNLLNSTRSQLKDIDYVLEPNEVYVTVQSKSMVSPLRLEKCGMFRMEGELKGKEPIPVKIFTEKGICSYVLEIDSVITYAQASGNRTFELPRGNETKVRIRDLDGSSIFELGRMERAKEDNKEEPHVFGFYPKRVMTWVSIAIWMVILGGIYYLKKFQFYGVMMMVGSELITSEWGFIIAILYAVVIALEHIKERNETEAKNKVGDLTKNILDKEMVPVTSPTQLQKSVIGSPAKITAASVRLDKGFRREEEDMGHREQDGGYEEAAFETTSQASRSPGKEREKKTFAPQMVEYQDQSGYMEIRAKMTPWKNDSSYEDIAFTESIRKEMNSSQMSASPTGTRRFRDQDR